MKATTPAPRNACRWRRPAATVIAGDPVLALYGVALAAAEALAFANWSRDPALETFVASGAMAICWPFWEDCAAARILEPGQVRALVGAGLALSLGAAAAFARCAVAALRGRPADLPRASAPATPADRAATLAWLALAACEVLRLALLVQDFRLRLNQHLMATWITAAFLFVPERRRVIPALLVSFYFWAGVLKLDGEWLSGSALYHLDRFWVPADLLPAACAYVVVLELVLVFGLFSSRAWLFLATLGQLAVFHLFSWPVVGPYYPLLMGLLLSIFPLARFLDPAGSDEGGPADAAAATRRAGWPLAMAAAFAATQCLPLAFPGDTAITGQGRLLSLHMFDARVVCESTLTLHHLDGRAQEVPVDHEGQAVRIACDPVFHWNVARAACRDFRDAGWIRDLDLVLRSRRSSEEELRDVVRIEGFCGRDPGYDVLRPNDWILP